MIHIIGAGWYGCHLISELIEGKHDYVCWEKSDGVLNGASSHNQNRLHLGFHYPRNYLTRAQSKKGFDKFKEKYGFFTSEVNRNVYAISDDSLVDFKTYLSIFRYEKYELEVLNPKAIGLGHCDGAVSVSERLIEHKKAKTYWASRKLNIVFDQPMTLINDALYDTNGSKVSKSTDLIIDCTWGELRIPEGYYEEYFLTFIIRCDMSNIGALTIMDGPFFSIFPYLSPGSNETTYTLTHVKYGILNSKDLDESEMQAIYKLILSDIFKYHPDIASTIKLDGYFVAKKLKPKSLSQSRATEVKRVGNVITVVAGKIDAIFTAQEMLMLELKNAAV
jgi:hypothetical protein